jgi:hypothetical protein
MNVVYVGEGASKSFGISAQESKSPNHNRGNEVVLKIRRVEEVESDRVLRFVEQPDALEPAKL